MTIGIEALIGVVMPVIIEFVAKYIKSTSGKFIVSLIIPLLAGTIINWENLGVGNIETILGSGAVIFAAAQAVYKLYFKDSVLQRKISG